MSTVAELDSDLSNNVGDPNSQTWSQSQRISAMNQSQIELVNHVLAFTINNEKVYELLSELQVTETPSIGTSGLNLNTGLSTRNYLTNGFAALQVLLNNKLPWCKKITLSNIGLEMNKYKAGTNVRPHIYIFSNILFLLADIGIFPVASTIYYIGEPFTLGIASGGSGKNQVVSTPDINVAFHQLLIKMAEVKLLNQRNDDKDVRRIQLKMLEIDSEFRHIVTGKIGEIGDKEPKGGEFHRESKENQNATQQ